jgi:hypothetical protein
VDPEHFGLSIAYSHGEPPAEVLRSAAARRRDIDPHELVPAGVSGLRAFIQGCIDAGLSKFVVRPAGPVASWAEEAAWLGEAILDLQT